MKSVNDLERLLGLSDFTFFKNPVEVGVVSETTDAKSFTDMLAFVDCLSEDQELEPYILYRVSKINYTPTQDVRVASILRAHSSAAKAMNAHGIANVDRVSVSGDIDAIYYPRSHSLDLWANDPQLKLQIGRASFSVDLFPQLKDALENPFTVVAAQSQPTPYFSARTDLLAGNFGIRTI